jgi:regulator of sigma E protease
MSLLEGAVDLVLLLVILVGLVVVHELGHFLAARRANVRVHEFGIGFPPRAAVLHRGKETTWSVNWLPIGGFVRLEGEEGESVDPRAFVNQPLRTRLGILVAGVGMNVGLAWLIFTLIALLADPVSTVRVASVQAGSPAASIGLVGGRQIATTPEGLPIYDRSGDLIVAVDGKRFPMFDDVQVPDPALAYLRTRAGEEVTLSVRHPDGSLEDLTVRLRTPEQAAEQGALGIGVRGFETEPVGRGIVESVVIGFQRTVDASTLIIRGVADLVANIGDPPVAGPVGILTAVGAVRELPPSFFFWLVGLLSANLAVINILPFPPMDGGRVAMALAQRALPGRITPALERSIYLTGFLALMALLVWITLFDIRRLGGG